MFSLCIARLPHLRPSASLLTRTRTLASPSLALLNSFSRPSPPPLPRAQQQEFEELLRRVQNPARASASDLAAEGGNSNVQPGEEQLHPDYRPRPKPKWAGKVNPQTGEVDGPKQEPLEHGESRFAGVLGARGAMRAPVARARWWRLADCVSMVRR